MKNGQKLGLALLLVLGACSALMAQTATPPPQTFGATVYLDYRYFLTNNGPITLKPTDPTRAYLNNQFIFRRAYLTYENKINDNLKFRFRFDADNTANVTGVTISGTPPAASTSKDDKLRPYMKHLYVEYANFLVQNMLLNVGMIETLTFKPSEDRWGYRSVAKTLVDGYKDITKKEIDATSADLGFTMKYSLAKFVKINVGVYNGAGYTKLEFDGYKKVHLQAQLTPVAGISFVGYYDYEKQQPTATVTSPTAATYKVDAFFEMVKNVVLGFEWFVYQNDLYRATNPDTEAVERYDVGGWSVFGRTVLKPDRLALFARYDSYAPNSFDKANQDMSLVIAGVDWAPFHPSWKLQPNIWFYHYKNPLYYNSSLSPTDYGTSDVGFNLTFFLSF